MQAIRWMTASLDLPAAGFEAGREFWQAVTATVVSAPRGPGGEFATLVPAQGDAFLRIQRVRTGLGGCHLDLHVGNVGQAADRARDLGAADVAESEGLLALSSPGGLDFCFFRDHGEAERPQPARWPGGHRSLVDQLSIDIPPESYPAECAFWQELTGCPMKAGTRPEFAYLERAAGIPLRLLLQRLDSVNTGNAEAGRCTAHLDLNCDNVAAERIRHEALGAELVRELPGWTTLRDPAGLSYCITPRNPATGKLDALP
jgi:hypothetical protein